MENKQRGHFWTEEELNLLGTTKDKDLAKKLRLSKYQVFYKRSQLKIPSFVTRKPIACTHDWTKKELALLGTDSDSNIAEKIGISSYMVRRWRVKLSISSFTS